MVASLSSAQVAQYHRDGYLSPCDAMSAEQAAQLRHRLESGEQSAGGLSHDRRRKMHLYLRWVNDLVRQPTILDAVESLIGPDILLYHITLWIKEPRTDAFISWHQDSTYFGLDPDDQHVTAWVALSVSDLESGCVQVVPGSHRQGQVRHDVGDRERNMLKTGQSLDVPDDADIRTMILRPGQFSLHHTHLLHNSMPNRSSDRRIGLGVSYIPTRCRGTSAQRLSATLVRGVDRYGHFDLETTPEHDFEPAALERHAAAMADWHRAREELIARAHEPA